MGADALVIEGRPPSSAFQTDDPGAPNSSASWVGTFLNARAGTIYAGSSQIQRNIIGEMMLGLPEGAATRERLATTNGRRGGRSPSSAPSCDIRSSGRRRCGS